MYHLHHVLCGETFVNPHSSLTLLLLTFGYLSIYLSIFRLCDPTEIIVCWSLLRVFFL